MKRETDRTWSGTQYLTDQTGETAPRSFVKPGGAAQVRGGHQGDSTKAHPPHGDGPCLLIGAWLEARSSRMGQWRGCVLPDGGAEDVEEDNDE